MSGNSVIYLGPSSAASPERRASLLGLYVAMLALSVLTLSLSLALGLVPLVYPHISLWQFFFFLALAISAEKARILIGRLEVSASFLAYFLSAALLGPLASLTIAVLAQVVHLRRGQWSRNLCFSAAAGLEAGFAGLIYWVFPHYLGASAEVLVIGGIAAGVAFQLMNYVLFVPVAALRGTYGPAAFWREGFQPFLPYHLFFLTVSVGLIWIFNRSESIVTFLLLLLPVLGLIFSFRSYSNLRTQVQENRRLALRNERLAMQAIAALVSSLDAKDDYTAGHSAAVAQWATALAADMGLSEHEVELTHLAGLMHDVGKIGIPDRVLKGNGSLDEIDRAIIATHSRKGSEILGAIDDFREVAQVVLYHHERYDGGGYPMGAAGNDIPFISRIIGVADAYSAMMSDRPYRKKLPLQVAKEQLEIHRGTQFDPQLVDRFLDMLARHDESYQRGEQADFRLEFQKVKFMRDLPDEGEGEQDVASDPDKDMAGVAV